MAPSNNDANLFGDFGNDANDDNDAGAGWADGFGDNNEANQYTTTFAKSELVEVLSASTQGKGKKSGLQVHGAVNYNPSTSQLQLELQFSNQSGGTIADFDLMINKNSFGVGADGQPKELGITYPEPFATSDVVCIPLKIHKNNADTKAPPKSPFQLQLALKSSLDIFYFFVPCLVHNLIAWENRMTQEDFKKFWDMLKEDKQFSLEFSGSDVYQGLSNLPDDVQTYLENNGFTSMARSVRQTTNQTIMYFGAKTVNNLPLLLEVAHPSSGGDAGGLTVTYKVPVLPLKPLLEDALRHLFSKRS